MNRSYFLNWKWEIMMWNKTRKLSVCDKVLSICCLETFLTILSFLFHALPATTTFLPNVNNFWMQLHLIGFEVGGWWVFWFGSHFLMLSINVVILLYYEPVLLFLVPLLSSSFLNYLCMIKYTNFKRIIIKKNNWKLTLTLINSKL